MARKQGTSRISGDRALDILITLKGRVTDIYGSAKYYHHTSDAARSRLDRDIYNTNEYNRLPDWCKSTIRSIDLELSRFIRSYLCYHAYYIDGVIVPSGNCMESPYRDAIINYSQNHNGDHIPSGFIWQGTTDKWYNPPL